MHRPILAVTTLFLHILAGLPKVSLTNFDLFGHVGNFIPTQNLLGNGGGIERRVGDLELLPYDKLPSGNRILLSADNDGVLKPVHEATSVDRTRAEHLLQLLGRQPKIVTLVNSARSLKGLDSYKGIVGVNLAAEHGTILLPAGEKQPIEFLIDRVGDIRSEIQVTASEYPGAKISYHDPKNSIAFKYPKTGQAVVEAGRVHEKILEKLRDSEFILATPHTGFSEVRHADVNKGNLVAKLLKIHEFDGGIALGDTDADEGMFIAMNQKNDPRFISVIVSNNPNQLTHAQYKVCSVDEVHNLLKHLANEDKSNPEMLW